jgi:hypothetical protein
MKVTRLAAAAVAGSLTAPALAQLNTFDIVVSSVVSPDHPSTTVEVWTTWDSAQYAFAGALFDMHASNDPGGFSDPMRMLKGPGSADGVVSLDSDLVTGAKPFQFHWWQNHYADTANPILIWRVTWSTADFTPRAVDLSTVTSMYDLYVNIDGEWNGFLGDFAEGSATIQVVPTPSMAGALAALAAPRRRR